MLIARFFYTLKSRRLRMTPAARGKQTRKTNLFIKQPSVVFRECILCAGLAALLTGNNLVFPEHWRSTLYPPDWYPGYRDEHGRQLPDFSWAGYHNGEKTIPGEISGIYTDITGPPYNADNSGEEDVTLIIQEALDFTGQSGGGIVYLPPGTYRISPRGDNQYALLIRHNNTVLRGAGADRTFLYNSDYNMRGKAVVGIAPREGGGWSNPAGKPVKLTEDVRRGSVTIRAEKIAGLKPGLEVIITHDVTKEFGQDHLVKPHRSWLTESWPGRLAGIQFSRRIVRINEEHRTVEIDTPINYTLKKRDNARIHRAASHISEIGLENMAIGMREHPGKGWGFDDYTNPGTAAYEVHGSYLIRMRMASNSWIRNIRTFRHETNRGGHHMLSNGILVDMSRQISVLESDIRNAQYKGGGGNGYGYVLSGNCILIQDCYGEGLRYVYSFKSMRSTGNVIHRSISSGTSDFHMHLSTANLIDNVQTSSGEFNAGCRKTWGTIPHGLTTYHSVFWNHSGRVNVTNQSDAVWLAGTGSVRGHNQEYHYNNEGAGKGKTLIPQSLYEDQLSRRLGRLPE